MARTCHTAIQVQVLETGRSGAQADPTSNLDACANPVTSHVFDFGHPKTCSFAASKEVPRYSKWPYTTNKEKPRGDPWGIRSLINQQYSGDTTPEQHVVVGLDSMLSTIKVHGLHDI